MDVEDIILFLSVFEFIWHMLPEHFTKCYGSKQSFHDDQQTLSQHLSNRTYVIPTRSRLFTKFLCLLPANFSYHVPRYPGVFRSHTWAPGKPQTRELVWASFTAFRGPESLFRWHSPAYWKLGECLC